MTASPVTAAAVIPCPNCGATVEAVFCGACGQSKHDHSRSLGEFLHELSEHHLFLDSKTARSILALVLRPGELTRAYSAGQRVRYVSPIRLYLASSFLFFLVLWVTNTAIVQFDNQPSSDPAPSAAPPSATPPSAAPPSAAPPSAAPPSAAPPSAAPPSAAPGDPSAPGASKSIARFLDTDGDDLTFDFDASTLAPSVRFFARVHPPSPAAAARVPTVATGDPRATKVVGRFLDGFRRAVERPTILNEVLDEWLGRLLIGLLPVVAAWLALIHRRKPLFFVDHLAFALHGQSAGFLIATAAVGIHLLDPGLRLINWQLGIVLIYSMLAYRRVYGSGWIGTAFAILVIGSTYLILLFSGLLGILAYALWSLPVE